MVIARGADDSALVGAWVLGAIRQDLHHLARYAAEQFSPLVSVLDIGPQPLQQVVRVKASGVLAWNDEETREGLTNTKHQAVLNQLILAHKVFERDREDLLAIHKRDTVIQTPKILPGVGN